MGKFKEYYSSDCYRYSGGRKGGNPPSYQKKLLFWFRRSQTCKKGLLNRLNRFFFRYYASKHGIEFSPKQRIGKGLYIGHPYNITINNDAIIGNNCNIHKGVLIGQENRGVRKGAPSIGNEVWIGINSAIVGNISIGDDVLIAPNSYVNCDVPSHSIVFGNPCIIKHKDNATEEYIKNKV